VTGATGYFGELARLLHVGSKGEQYLTVLGAYMDESGLEDDPTPIGFVFCYAGLLASRDDWEKFSSKWVEFLLGEGLPDPPELHMKKFLHSRGDFAGWDSERKARVLATAIDLINETPAIGHACITERGTPQDWVGKYAGHLMANKGWYYTGGLGHAALTLAVRSPMFVEADEEIPFICGDNEEWGPELTRWYKKMQVAEEFPAEVRRRLGPFTLASPKRIPPLQAADVIAYESRRKLIDWKASGPESLRRSVVRLESGKRMTYCVHDIKTLEPIFEQVGADKEFQEELAKRRREIDLKREK
jgi:hypothetical protein